MKNINESLAIFESYKIRRHYDENREVWLFSVIDIIRALTNQADYQMARKYWNKLHERLKKEGSQLVTKCHQLKLEAADGKKYDKYRTERFDDLLADKLLRVMEAQDRLADNNTPPNFKRMIILAEAGFRKLDAAPSDLSQYTERTDLEELPDGYSIYESPGIVYSYYVRYQGSRPEGDIVYEGVDEWYGRF